MKISKLTPKQQGYPELLKTISGRPQQLFYMGQKPAELLKFPAVAIVGSRKVSSYGKRVTEELAAGLARQGVVIISGLALGVDAIAHAAALEAGGMTMAVMPSGLDQIYPLTNRGLARKIIDSGGSLVSEYPALTEPQRHNFIARNRIVSGLAQALIITEAALKSGSLHTAKFALEQGREVGAVPGSIYSLTSVGTNNLIKTGAHPITSVEEASRLLGLDGKPTTKAEIIASSKEEHILITLMRAGVSESDELLEQSKLEPAVFNQTLTLLEITGKAKATTGQWYLT